MFQHTAARRRLLGNSHYVRIYFVVSTHSRPKAAAAFKISSEYLPVVSTHSRPKAAAPCKTSFKSASEIVSTHSRPKAAANKILEIRQSKKVSTHSRPKAAAHKAEFAYFLRAGFNTQPPEGGCSLHKKVRKIS